ncbi:MAG: TRAP transporter substrate-binding protein [Lachnospiraceae bacterium]|nr:TRAP transporter substrate-binding protein [Lachnospiraceae bacterium]
MSASTKKNRIKSAFAMSVGTKKNRKMSGKTAAYMAACIIISCLIAVVLTGCSTEKSQASIFQILKEERESEKTGGVYEPVIINLVHSSPVSSAINRVANMFKTLIENRSKGKMIVEIYPNDSLGYIYDYGRALGEGTVDAWIGSGAAKLNTVVYWSPTLTDASLEDIKAFTGSGIFYDRLKDECAEKGYLPLGIFPAQYRILTSNDPISSIDDFKDIKMRSYMEQSLEKVYWNAMGIGVTSCDIHELYDALEDGTVNAQSNSLPIIVSNRLYEQQSYSMELRHMIYYDGLYIGKTFYDELEDSLREVLDYVADEIRVYARDMYEAEYSRCETVLEKSGVKTLPIEDGLREQVKAMAAPDLEKALREAVGDEDVDFVINGLEDIRDAGIRLPERNSDG